MIYHFLPKELRTVYSNLDVLIFCFTLSFLFLVGEGLSFKIGSQARKVAQLVKSLPTTHKTLGSLSKVSYSPGRPHTASM